MFGQFQKFFIVSFYYFLKIFPKNILSEIFVHIHCLTIIRFLNIRVHFYQKQPECDDEYSLHYLNPY